MDASKFRIPIETSKNINTIYCIHWCIIGFTDFVVCQRMGVVFSYAAMYAYAIVLLFVTFFLARFYKSMKAKFMESYAIK